MVPITVKFIFIKNNVWDTYTFHSAKRHIGVEKEKSVKSALDEKKHSILAAVLEIIRIFAAKS